MSSGNPSGKEETQCLCKIYYNSFYCICLGKYTELQGVSWIVFTLECKYKTEDICEVGSEK